ncbi:iron-containing alcohol dehydrogenase, partial [Crossiella cryophila]
EWNPPAGEPTLAGLAGGADLAQAHRPELVLAIGGGATMDSAKVLAVLGAAPAGVTAADVIAPGTYRPADVVPLWTVPTLSGSGAEVTRGTVIADGHGVKNGFANPARHPALAVLDPTLAVGAPAAVLGPPTVDVFCHATESLLAGRGFPISDLLAATAATLVVRSLAEPLGERSVTGAGQLMTAAVFGAMAFSSGSGLTTAHEYSDIAGLRLGLPHGYAASLLLPAVLARQAELGHPSVARLGRLFADAGLSGDPGRDLAHVLGELGAPRLPEVCSPEQALELVELLYAVGDDRHWISRQDAITLVGKGFELDA